MNDELTLAFVQSPHPWVGRWQRLIRDHGPGRVVDVIAESRTAFDVPWRVLLVAADHPLVAEGFVERVHAAHRGIVAVIDPADPRAKQRALDAAVDALVEQDASPEELERVLAEAATLRPVPRTAASRRRSAVAPEPVPTGVLVAVGGPPGAPVAPVALALTAALGRRRSGSAVLVDADETYPAVAQTAGLAGLPNLLSACAAVRAGKPLGEQCQDAGFEVVAGLADPAQWPELSPPSVRATLSALAADHDRVVVTVGPILDPPVGRVDRFGVSRSVLAGATSVVAVGEATPVGLARLTHWVAGCRSVAPRASLWLVAAGVGRGRWRRGEVERALEGLAALDGVGASGVRVLSIDARRLERTAWDGGVVRGGPFAAGMKRLAKEVTA